MSAFCMAQFTVRNIEEDVKVSLKQRAARHGCSLEEIRRILRTAIRDEILSRPGLGSRIAAYFAPEGLTEDLPELHGQLAHPADFQP
jgi:hypothetical protein